MSTRPAFLGLGLLASVLAAALSLELDSGQPAEDATGIVPVRHVPKAQPRVASEDPEDHTDAWVATALARPLFSRDRKPTPAAAKAGGPALTSLPRLTGVVIGPFGRTAIFAGSGDKDKPVAVGEGRTLGPYTVQAIQPGRVTVTGPDGERIVPVSADAATRQALAAEMPQPQPQPGQQQPGVPPGTLPGLPGAPMQRPNLLNLRPGAQFQRGLPPGLPQPRPAQEGSE